MVRVLFLVNSQYTRRCLTLIVDKPSSGITYQNVSYVVAPSHWCHKRRRQQYLEKDAGDRRLGFIMYMGVSRRPRLRRIPRTQCASDSRWWVGTVNGNRPPILVYHVTDIEEMISSPMHMVRAKYRNAMMQG
jgi:hypothetical protein